MMGLLRKLTQLEIGHVFGSDPGKGGYFPMEPLTRLFRVGGIGDSRTNDAGSDAASPAGNPSSRTRFAKGYAGWLEQLFGWNVEAIKLYAVSGSELDAQLQYISNPAVTNAAAVWGTMDAQALDLALALGGRNDLADSEGLATVITRKQAVTDALRAMPTTPRLLNLEEWPSSGVVNADRKSLNSYIRSHTDRFIKSLNLDYLLDNPSNPGVLLPEMSVDENGAFVHTNAHGARLIALAVFNRLKSLGWMPVPVVYPRTLDAADDPTNFIRDFASNNSQRQKIAYSATVPANFGTGSNSATGYSFVTNAAWTSPPIITTQADGANLNKIRIEFPAQTAPAAELDCRVTVTSSSTGISAARAAALGVVAGKSYRAGMKIKAIGMNTLCRMELRFRMTIDGAVKNTYALTAYGAPPGVISGVQKGYDSLETDFEMDILSPEIKVPAGATTVQIDNISVAIAPLQGYPCSGVVELSRFYVREHVFLPAWP